jgi:hypothetical protein
MCTIKTFGAFVSGSPIPAIQWWRQLPADAFTKAHVDVVRSAISGVSIIGESRWANAVRADPAAAIGIALRTANRCATPLPVVDLVMSAVLLAALAGDPAALMVLIKMIKREGAETTKSRLAASWLGGNRNTGRPSIAATRSNRGHVPSRTMAGA